MSGDFTKIKLSRTRLPITGSGTEKTLSNLTGASDDVYKLSHTIDFGEALIVDNTDGTKQAPCKFYLLVGSHENGSNGESQLVTNAPIFKAFKDKDWADRLAFVTYDNKLIPDGLQDESGNSVPIKYVNSTTHTITDEYDDSNNILKGGAKYRVLCAPVEKVKRKVAEGNFTTKYEANQVVSFDFGDTGIYVSGKGVLYGAAWNDYAERRTCTSTEKPGTVVCEVGDGTVEISNKKLQACPYVISDTYGFCAGKGNIAVAVSGKVLVYTNDDVKIGDCVGAGEDGTAVRMTREEIVTYPDRILGIVCEIPTYDKWGNDVEVDGRVWINIK